jgi:glycosyltransferase involved in cell wall biosynthesis
LAVIFGANPLQRLERLSVLPFTVFTPTYNRAHCLRRVFDSLGRQPQGTFEWLVVDDGSTDDTPALLEELARTAAFPVRVIRQTNGGKHRAHNTAVEHAAGELTVILDSDDELVPGALDVLWREWQAIPDDRRGDFAGIIGHSANAAGQLVGLPYPFRRVDGKLFELTAAGVVVGEKLPCYRTDILRQFRFPERPGSTAYVPEGVVWVQIGSRYNVRCIDDTVRVYHRDAADTGAVMNRYARRQSNAWGRMQYWMVVLNLSGRYWPRFASTFVKAAAGYVRDGLHAGYSFRRQFRPLDGNIARILWAVSLPIGAAAWSLDRIRR